MIYKEREALPQRCFHCSMSSRRDSSTCPFRRARYLVHSPTRVGGYKVEFVKLQIFSRNPSDLHFLHHPLTTSHYPLTVPWPSPDLTSVTVRAPMLSATSCRETFSAWAQFHEIVGGILLAGRLTEILLSLPDSSLVCLGCHSMAG